ncbi:MAG: thioesterase family protein [Acidimicrobiia bacterium]
MSTPEAVFIRDGERYVPTALARGPWSAEAQHGGAPAGLVADAIERLEPGPTFVARLTLELLKPVPLAPLTLETELVRPGKKVQVVEARVRSGDDIVVLARALRLRTADLDLPRAGPEGLPPDLPAPNQSKVLTDREMWVEGLRFWSAFEMRLARGTWFEPGPASMWFRLAVPMVAGEEPSPLVRVAAAADFGNGVSAAFERGRFLFINPDLTVTVHRPARGEWVCLDALTHAEPVGVGLAESALYDEEGRIGRSVQALLIDRL